MFVAPTSGMVMQAPPPLGMLDGPTSVPKKNLGVLESETLRSGT